MASSLLMLAMCLAAAAGGALAQEVTRPDQFPYECQCIRRNVVGPYRMDFESGTENAVGDNRFCYRVKAMRISPAPSPCGNFDLRKIELDIKKPCRSAMKMLTWDGQKLSTSASGHDDDKAMAKILRPRGANLASYAYIASKPNGVQVCFTIGGACNTQDLYFAEGRRRAFFNPSKRCCPDNGVSNPRCRGLAQESGNIPQPVPGVTQTFPHDFVVPGGMARFNFTSLEAPDRFTIYETANPSNVLFTAVAGNVVFSQQLRECDGVRFPPMDYDESKHSVMFDTKGITKVTVVVDPFCRSTGWSWFLDCPTPRRG